MVFVFAGLIGVVLLASYSWRMSALGKSMALDAGRRGEIVELGPEPAKCPRGRSWSSSGMVLLTDRRLVFRPFFGGAGVEVSVTDILGAGAPQLLVASHARMNLVLQTRHQGEIAFDVRDQYRWTTILHGA